MRVTIVAAVIVLLAGAAPARAQDPYNVTVNVTELSRIFTELYGPDGPGREQPRGPRRRRFPLGAFQQRVRK